MKGTDMTWAEAYERRMRRFNLEVVLIALSALTDRDNLEIVGFRESRGAQARVENKPNEFGNRLLHRLWIALMILRQVLRS